MRMGHRVSQSPPLPQTCNLGHRMITSRWLLLASVPSNVFRIRNSGSFDSDRLVTLTFALYPPSWQLHWLLPLRRAGRHTRTLPHSASKFTDFVLRSVESRCEE